MYQIIIKKKAKKFIDNIVDGDSFVKKLGKDILISVNEDYSDIPITEETHCLGLVVDKISHTPESQENSNN